jgi:hypothetical protein
MVLKTQIRHWPQEISTSMGTMVNYHNPNFRESTANGLISTQTGLDISFPSPPPTMPNTPCKPLPPRNARVQASLPNPDSANEAQVDQPQSELQLIREMRPVDYSISQPCTVRPRKEGSDPVAHVVGRKERRQGTSWRRYLCPCFIPMAPGKTNKGESFLN